LYDNSTSIPTCCVGTERGNTGSLKPNLTSIFQRHRTSIQSGCVVAERGDRVRGKYHLGRAFHLHAGTILIASVAFNKQST
jgi:hypothetical protein